MIANGPTTAVLWKPFTRRDGRVFSLDHLHPHVIEYPIAATIMRPDWICRARITYSLHCFTRAPGKNETVDPSYVYFNNPENRLFAEDRHEFSLDLPGILAQSLDRNCRKTDRRSYVMFCTLLSRRGPELGVFFRVTKAAQQPGDCDVNLMVLSSHPRNGLRGLGKPVKLRDLLRQKA